MLQESRDPSFSLDSWSFYSA